MKALRDMSPKELLEARVEVWMEYHTASLTKDLVVLRAKAKELDVIDGLLVEKVCK